MLGFAIIAAFAAAAAPASEASTTTPSAATAAPADPDQKIHCRREEVTGSLARQRRTCMTIAEWRKRDSEAVSAAETMADRGRIQPTTGQ